MKNLLFCSLVLFIHFSTGYNQYKNELKINGYGGYGSNMLNDQFLNKLVVGGFIDDNQKETALRFSDKYNRVGADLNYEITFHNYKDTLFEKFPKWKLYFGLGSYTQYSSTFTRDLFTSVFYGNRDFIDEKAIIGGSQILLLDFKKITVGFTHTEKKLSLGLSVISGNDLTCLHIKTGDYQVQNDGSSIVLNGDAVYNQSDSLGNGYLSFSGIGTAIDIRKEWKFFEASITNLGFTTWKRNPSYNHVVFDDYSFQGVTINDINSAKDVTINNVFDTLISENKSKTFTKMLPFEFNLNSTFGKEKALAPIFGLRLRAFSNYHPYQYLGIKAKITKQIGLTSALSYGGYNNFEGKLRLNLYGKSYVASLGTDHFYGLISNTGFGNSIFFNLSLQL